MFGLERPPPAPKDDAIRDAKINIWRAPSLARLESPEEPTLIRFVSQLAAHNGSHMSTTHVGSNAVVMAKGLRGYIMNRL